jgi:ATP-dependent exoDNAse (exonuclease V) alpha subunit
MACACQCWFGARSTAIDELTIDMKPQPEASTQEVLAGLVERVTYHNAENGFCVLRAKVRGHRDVVTVVGHAATIAAGEWITASGEWANDRTHGQQFKARFLRTSPPTSADGIEKYLSSGMIRGVGPVYAKKLVRAFGEKVFRRHRGNAGPAARGRPLPAFSPPGPSRRRCGRSWFSCTATVSAQRGRYGSSRPMVPTPSRS